MGKRPLINGCVSRPSLNCCGALQRMGGMVEPWLIFPWLRPRDFAPLSPFRPIVACHLNRPAGRATIDAALTTSLGRLSCPLNPVTTRKREHDSHRRQEIQASVVAVRRTFQVKVRIRSGTIRCSGHRSCWAMIGYLARRGLKFPNVSKIDQRVLDQEGMLFCHRSV